MALISGGGSGHEPAHAGFVGPGLLHAAVCGEIFASPTVDAILAAILAVTGPAGCLLIVKNYTGDRLNFGLAAAQARAQYGLKVAMIVVGDDIALGAEKQNGGVKKARGIAGTLFLHKILGAASEEGEKLEKIQAMGQNLADSIKSLGVSYSVCTQPFQEDCRHLPGNLMELGLGIHGEPGRSKCEVTNTWCVVQKMLQILLQAEHGILEKSGDEGMVVMVNNLGVVPAIEMQIIAKDVLECLLTSCVQCPIYLVGPAPMMTSLDMNGFSLSILPLGIIITATKVNNK